MCCRTAFLNKIQISDYGLMINFIVYKCVYFVSHMLFIIKGKAIV